MTRRRAELPLLMTSASGAGSKESSIAPNTEKCMSRRSWSREAAAGTPVAALTSMPSPVYMPMVVPPRPFTSYSADGGYLKLPLKPLKRKLFGRAQQYFEKADMSNVLSALNALQNTDYRINKAVYETMRRA